MKLGTEVGLGTGHIVLDGDPAPPQKKRGGAHPQFSAHVCCDQTAGWIKMPLGTEVGLGPGQIVLDGNPAPPKGGQQPPLFGRCLLWPNGCPSQLLLSTCTNGRPKTAEPIEMPFGMWTRVGPSNYTLDGVQVWFIPLVDKRVGGG